MLITEYLKLDHARIRTLLGVLEGGLGRNRASMKVRLTDTLRELIALQRVHEAVEEGVLLPALDCRQTSFEPRLVAEFERAHKETVKRINDLHECAWNDYPLATIERALRSYTAAMRAHMTTEESSLFPLAEMCLPRVESEAMTQKAIAIETRAMDPGLARS